MKERLTFNDRMHLRFHKELTRWRRCPECGERGYGTSAPRWEDDKVAQMLGIAHKGCPCCGHGSVGEGR